MKKLNIPMFEEDTDVDFSAMSTSKHCIEKILQKAKIQLDEEGTIAAAATAVMDDSFEIESYATPKIFNAKRPFIYIINNGLFIGAYTKGELF